MSAYGKTVRVFLLVLGLALIGQVALACSCAEPDPPLDTIRRTPVIFTGTATEEVFRDGGSTIATTFAVTRYIKGGGPSRLTVQTAQSSGICGGRFFRVGQTATVFAHPRRLPSPDPTIVTTGGCQEGMYARRRTATDALLQQMSTEDDRLDAALARDPDNPSLLLERAVLLEQRRDPRAVTAFSSLAARLPDQLPARFGLVRAAFRAMDYEAVNRQLDEIAAIAPTEPAVERLRRFARLGMGDFSVLEHNRDLRGIELTGPEQGWDLNLAGRDLRGADFSNAQLNRFSAPQADLRRARFNGATFRRANFWQADLRGADLSGLSAHHLSLVRARLDGMDLSGLDLRSVWLTEASLRGVHGADVDLRQAELSGANLRGARLPGARLDGAKLSNTDLADAMLVGAELRGARLDGANLTRANIRGARLDGAYHDCRTRLPRGETPASLGLIHITPLQPDCP